MRFPKLLGRWVRPPETSLVYLASPYSHDDPSVREDRFQAACRAAAHLMRAGLRVFSPIAHTHPILLASDLPTGWEFWEAYDEAVLRACRALVVLKLDGWKDSTGVRGEVRIARRLNLTTYDVETLPECLDVLAKTIKVDFGTTPPERRRTSPGRRGRAA